MKINKIIISIVLIAAFALTACSATTAAISKLDLNERETRSLAFGAVLSTRNSMSYGSLLKATKSEIASYESVLESAWGIFDRNTALETLDWLAVEGHHISMEDNYYGYDEILTLLRKGQAGLNEAGAELENELRAYNDVVTILKNDYGYTEAEINNIKTVAAWDYDRLVTLARWCYGCGYVTADEAWEYIDFAAQQGTGMYDGWRSYFAGVLIGRAIWSEDDGFDSGNKKIADQLLNSQNSIYETTEFKLSIL